MEIEVMDRVYTLQTMVDELIADHTVIDLVGANEEVTLVQDTLAKIYNKVGLHFDRPLQAE